MTKSLVLPVEARHFRPCRSLGSCSGPGATTEARNSAAVGTTLKPARSEASGSHGPNGGL